MAIAVFGSINMDLVVRTARLPQPGQTLSGQTFFTVSGGKGANQAVACARLGVRTLMIGRVGDDVFGGTLRDNLHAYGVDVSGIHTTEGVPSGVALITVDDSAENTIIVVPGANGMMNADDVARLKNNLEGVDVLLLQLEVPLPAVIQAAQLAYERSMIVVLDPAPAQPLPPELYHLTDIITPNESEAQALVGFPVQDEASAARAAQILIERGALRAVIKMGSKGAYWASEDAGRFMPAFRVNAVDTVAAGDAFNGALAVALSEGTDFEAAVRWGLAGGAVSVTRAGAQPSMPTREELIAQMRVKV